VAREEEIPEGGRKVVAIGEIEIGLFRVDGAILAYRNECPHQGGPVCQGRLMQGVEERLDAERRSLGIHYVAGSAHLVCPWHGWEFDLRSGRHCGHDATRLAAHPVTIQDGDVYVGIRG
jgi:nitrite reductase/ring-hydroxylating ferredoxin subunit